LTRPTPTAGTQTLTWDPEGHLATATDTTGTTSYLYDADGNRLIRRDPTGKTLYLPGQELRYTNSTAAKTTTRYYGHAGSTIATRTTDGVTWLSGDHQGTSQTAITATNQNVTTRRQTPFGATRAGTGTWPATMDKGFVGGTNDNTGLTHIGAREYDPAIGRFISRDPVVDTNNPQQMHGYAYANNSPVSLSDPTGLRVCLEECGSADDKINLASVQAAHKAAQQAAEQQWRGTCAHLTRDDCDGPTDKIIRISPHVLMHSNDPSYGQLQEQWDKYRARYPRFGEVELWRRICYEQKDVCKGDFASLVSWTLPDPDGDWRNATMLGDEQSSILIGTASTAGVFFVRSLLNPESMVGVTEEELKAMLPEKLEIRALNDGDGWKAGSPNTNKDKQGRPDNFGRRWWVEWNNGIPNNRDPLHRGPFMRTSAGGLQYRAAGDGNPVIDDPAIPSLQVNGRGPADAEFAGGVRPGGRIGGAP
jgi:RHS repeat-associated protein